MCYSVHFYKIMNLLILATNKPHLTNTNTSAYFKESLKYKLVTVKNLVELSILSNTLIQTISFPPFTRESQTHSASTSQFYILLSLTS